MTGTTILKQSTRSVLKNGREFIIFYELGTQVTSGKSVYIRARLKEKSPLGQEKAGSCVELTYLYPEIGEKIFDLIANAQEPVFPVHLPEIVRDQLSAALFGIKPYF